MGVVCVLSYRVPEGRTGQQTAELLQKRVEELGAVKTGNFSVDCDLYQAAQAGIPQRTLQVLHNSEQPASCFCVLDTAGQRCLVADIHMDLLMTKLKDYYEKKNVKMESKGMRYELGDFVIKVGSVVLGQSMAFKGVLVEVEYTPCVMLRDCWALMQEFMQGFLGHSLEQPTAHFKSKMEAQYQAEDTVLQYLEQFNNLRKVNVPGAMPQPIR